MILLVAGLLVETHRLWLQAVGDILVVRDQPVPADGVVVLGGDSRGGRTLRGAELVRDGYAPKLYVLEDLSCLRGYCMRWSQLWRAGVGFGEMDPGRVIPREAVVPLLDDVPMSAGTYEEAQAAWERLEPLGVHRLLLVTDEYHSRRATLTWRKVIGGAAEIISVPCTDHCVSMHGWWRDKEAAKSAWLELLRFGAYIAMGRIL
jgi:uncharacterized SAM-binding protein YcdF (DUF218 family)